MRISNLIDVKNRNYHISTIETKGILDENLREEYLKPGFEEFKNFAKERSDVDLDGEIYADQLHSLLQRISPEMDNMKLKSMLDGNKIDKTIAKRKPSDEEKIMDHIHGLDGNNGNNENPVIKPFVMQPRIRTPLGGAFEGFANGPRSQRQTFSYQVIRKPNGTYSTSTVVDPDGNTKTVIKRTIDGETNTQTIVNGVDVDTNKAIDGNAIIGGAADKSVFAKPNNNNFPIDCGRYLFVNKDGYALPKNLW